MLEPTLKEHKIIEWESNPIHPFSLVLLLMRLISTRDFNRFVNLEV
jgi:hypothetical protein